MNRQTLLTLTLCVELEAIKCVRVKAHKRIVNGKVVKVRSHYRRVGGRGFDANALLTVT